LRKSYSELIENWLEDPSFINWANRSKEEDEYKWEQHFLIHPEQLEVAKIARLMVQGLPFREIDADLINSQKSLAKLQGRLDALEQKESSLPGRFSFHQKRTQVNFGKLVACIAFLIIIPSAIYFNFFYNDEVTVTTGFGELEKVNMPDGSVLTLNANSMIRYSKRTPRAVHFEGEAYFEIMPKPLTGEHFTVITDDLVVKVLGTAFNVNARNDQTEVVLEEGKVELNIQDFEEEVMHLEPGDLVSYSKKENKLLDKRDNVSIVENTSWKSGALIFKNTPLIKALYEIEDIYGIQFVVINDEINKEEITGGVPISNLEVALQTLSEVYDFRIRSEGKRYFLTKINNNG